MLSISGISSLERRWLIRNRLSRLWPCRWAVVVALFCMVLSRGAAAQAPQNEDVKPVPLLTGSAGFVTFFDGGEPHLAPIVAPVLLVPLGNRWLFESRATFESDMVQIPGLSGFHGKIAKEVDYAQLDFMANRYVTVTAGRFLTPFGIYNERLYPVWIRNLQADPLILPIGVGPSNAGTGVMLRGGFKATSQFDFNYAVYFSTLSTLEPVTSDRMFGGRAGIFVRKARLEMGGSFQHRLQDDRTSAFGFHAIWQPTPLPLDIRAEYARSVRGSGYWIEPAYRLSQIPFWRTGLRRTQITARLQQFHVGHLPSDDLPSANTRQFELGANYYFKDGLRAVSSYGRQFSLAGNSNVWSVGLTYRFVIPLGSDGSPQ